MQEPRKPDPVKTPPPDAVVDPSGAQVNSYSRAVNPRKLFPIHFDLLMRHLFDNGETPEDWQVIAAEETILDEHGQEVEFHLVKAGYDGVWRCRLDVWRGQLRSITTC